MTPFGCRVTCTSRAVMCVSTETRKNVTNHRSQSQDKQSLALNGHVPHAQACTTVALACVRCRHIYIHSKISNRTQSLASLRLLMLAVTISFVLLQYACPCPVLCMGLLIIMMGDMEKSVYVCVCVGGGGLGSGKIIYKKRTMLAMDPNRNLCDSQTFPIQGKGSREMSAIYNIFDNEKTLWSRREHREHTGL